MSKNTKSIKKLTEKNPKKNITPKQKIVLEKSDDEIIEKKRITTPSKKTKKINKNNEDENDFENKIEQIREALKDNYSQQKKLMNDLKELTSLHKKEIRLSAKSGNRNN